MKTKEEILAKIENLMQEMQQLRNEVAALELVNPVVQDTVENVDKMDELACQYMQEEADSTPVIEEEVEELPAPPAEIRVDIEVLKNAKEPDPESVLGCQIITSLPDFYKGTCSVLRLHKLYFDNGQPKLYINKYKVVIIALDSKMQEIGRMITHWNNLSKFHTELSKRGINTHTGENWMPKIINLDLD